jgi:hypothetical protein
MQVGAWVNGAGQLTFDRDGNLIDGRHRAAAVYFSGVSIDTFFCVMPEKKFRHGLKRWEEDILEETKLLEAQLSAMKPVTSERALSQVLAEDDTSYEEVVSPASETGVSI